MSSSGAAGLQQFAQFLFLRLIQTAHAGLQRFTPLLPCQIGQFVQRIMEFGSPQVGLAGQTMSW